MTSLVSGCLTGRRSFCSCVMFPFGSRPPTLMGPSSRKGLTVTSLLCLATAFVFFISLISWLNASDCANATRRSIELLSSCGVKVPNCYVSLGIPALRLKRKLYAVTLRRLLVRFEKDFTRSKSSVAVVIIWQLMFFSSGRPCEPITGDCGQCVESFVNQSGSSLHKPESRSCLRVAPLDTKSAGFS